MFEEKKGAIEVIESDASPIEVEPAQPKVKPKKTTKAVDPVLEREKALAPLCGSYGSVDSIASIELASTPRWGLMKKLSLGWFGFKFIVTFDNGDKMMFGPVNPVMLKKRDKDWRKATGLKLQNSAYKVWEIEDWDESLPLAELQTIIEKTIGDKNSKDEDDD